MYVEQQNMTKILCHIFRDFAFLRIQKPRWNLCVNFREEQEEREYMNITRNIQSSVDDPARLRNREWIKNKNNKIAKQTTREYSDLQFSVTVMFAINAVWYVL